MWLEKNGTTFSEVVDLKVGIVGLGSVGQAAYSTLSEYYEVTGYDIDGRGNWVDILETDLILVCVSTNGSGNGFLDMANVNSVAQRLNDSSYGGLVILKSTLQPRTIDNLKEKFPRIRFSYVPEFLREKDAEEWFRNPDRIVYSCQDQDEAIVLQSFEWVNNQIPRIRMSNLEAEFGKLAHNSYIATKVTFTCEVERLCRINSIDASKVMEVVWRDRRVDNPSHLTPYLGGFGGKCVPKDTLALAMEDPDERSILHCLHERGECETVKKRLGSL